MGRRLRLKSRSARKYATDKVWSSVHISAKLNSKGVGSRLLKQWLVRDSFIPLLHTLSFSKTGVSEQNTQLVLEATEN